jgi:UDP-N-acetylmuramoylalanine--D-glutamate ligase
VNYRDYFKDKRVAIVGLGPHGEMIADIKFLLRNKVPLSLFDMRSEDRIKKYIMALSIGGLQQFTFGKIDGEELLSFDLILLSPEISQHSTFLRKAIEAGIQIEYPDIMFFKLAPPVTFIGVIGMCGKSTVTHLIYRMLKKSFSDYDDQGLFLIDPGSSNGALTHLKRIKSGDVVLVRIPETLMDYYYNIRMSPHVAVITTSISLKMLEFQTYNNFIVASDAVVDAMKSESNVSSKAKILRTRIGSTLKELGMEDKPIHDQENAALAIQAGELFKVSKDIAKEAIQGFLGLRGHIEPIKKVYGIEFYNDTASVTPSATLAALRTLSRDKKIVVILGGAYTGHDYTELIKNIPDLVSKIILLPGSGTIGFRKRLEKIEGIQIFQVLNLEEAVQKSRFCADKGDIVLFSPGFDAVGVDISRKERGERFVRAVREL